MAVRSSIRVVFGQTFAGDSFQIHNAFWGGMFTTRTYSTVDAANASAASIHFNQWAIVNFVHPYYLVSYDNIEFATTIESLTDGSLWDFTATRNDANGSLIDYSTINAAADQMFTTVTPHAVSYVTAQDGYADFSIVGGKTPKQYKRMWDGAIVPIVGQAFSITNLPPGTYTVRIIDVSNTNAFNDPEYSSGESAGFYNTVTFTIDPAVCNIIASADVLNTTTPYSSDGAIQINLGNAQSPVVFVLNGGNTYFSSPITGLPAGQYSITIVDAVGCQATINNIFVLSPPCTLAYTITKTDATTDDGSDGSITVITTDGQAPFQYKLNDGFFLNTNVFNNIPQGTQTITVRDAYGCENQQTVVIGGPAPYNNFYGDQYTSKVGIVFNQFPSSEKFWMNISEESDAIWKVNSATNEKGQDSDLTKSDFENRESVYYADFLKDKNSVNIEPPQIPILHGDQLLSKTLLVEIESDEIKYTKLRAVNGGFMVSKGHKT